jgi:proteasome accessory factor B
MADALERLTNLIALLLETRVPLSLERIAFELLGQYPDEIAARRGAFERDKALLREEGIPLEQVQLADGGTGYFIDRNRYELDLDLEDDEKRALQLAVAAVHLGVEWGNDALLKIGPDGPDESATLDVTGAFRASPSLPVLFDAHVRRRAVSFTYRNKTRQLEPWGLLTREGFWYVVGLEHGAGESRTFRLDRIDGAVSIDEASAFVVPEGFDPAAAVIDDPKTVGSGDGYAIVAIDAVRAPGVVAQLGEDAVVERTPERTVVRVPAAHVPAFRSWVIGLLDHAEVLGPPAVRDDLTAWLSTMVARR